MTQDQIQTILNAIAAVRGDIQVIKRDNRAADKIHDDHETRIRKTETYVATQAGEASSMTRTRAILLAIGCSTISGILGVVLSHVHF